MNTTSSKPPIAEEHEFVIETHGHKRVDPWFWLNDRDKPEVIAHLNAENSYVEAAFEPHKELCEKLFDEITSRIDPSDQSVPYTKNGYSYIARYEKGKEYQIHSRQRVSKGGPVSETALEELIDCNERANGKGYYSLGGLSISPDNNWMAVGEDFVGRRQYEIRFKRIDGSEWEREVLTNALGAVAWAADNLHVFYTVKNPKTLRYHKIFRHKIGTSQAEDVMVYEEKDDTFYCWASPCRSGKFIYLISNSTLTTEMRYISTENPLEPPKLFQQRKRGLEYYVEYRDGEFYVRTNHEATNFRLMKCASDQTSMEHWSEVLPHREEVYLEEILLFENWLAVNERWNGLQKLRLISRDGTDDHYLNFEDHAYTASFGKNPELQSTHLRYVFSSLAKPTSVIDYKPADKTEVLLKQERVLGDFNQELYETIRLMAPAADGTLIPISLVRRKDLDQSKPNPLLLYAYGSYGSSTMPYFSSARLSLLDRGFQYAIAHVRGGQELGRKWYENGKLLKKKNTFTDFIDCGSYLVQEGITTFDELYAYGGSAGGLLMGAIMNMAPEKFKGIIAAVPFVDVVTTMLDESIPLTTGEFDEWGNPKDPEYYHYILSYSPYDNVKAQAYPALLATTGLHDSQVQYWEPAKWVSKLRKMNTGKSPIYFKINMEAGHGGESGRFRRFRETALQYCFILTT